MSTSPASNSRSLRGTAIDQPSPKRVKRSYVACRRCHAQKLKCSGGEPCERCENSQGSTCEYPARDRKVSVTESYLKKLEAQSRHRRVPDEIAQSANSSAPVSGRLTSAARPSSHGQSAESDISNPLSGSGRLLQQQSVGESTCAVFADRLLQTLQPEEILAPANPEQSYVRRAEFARGVSDPGAFQLPERIRANLLIRVALRFIGQDYHFFLHKEFFSQLEQAYASKTSQGTSDPSWTCKFFVVLALGELYCGTASIGDTSGTVPGTNHFVNAVLLLQDLYEEPSLTQVEIMLLFCFYSNALGRIKSAHVYSGLAIRFCTSLGLHRQSIATSSLESIELEHRIRLWWTTYIFDRSLTSRLGQPLSIQDEDIDVTLPSVDRLSLEEKEEMGVPAHLNANIELARIEGSIMRNIYSPSSAAQGGFLHNVRTILNKLRTWDANIAPSLRWSQGCSHRPVASLQLHFNQCIILTTRPVLLHILKTRNPFGDAQADASTSSEPHSETATMLSDACISAARTSNSILSQLYVENALAIFGHFDAHYLFASTLVLIISAIIAPSAGDSDAVQTAFHLLKMMRESGNVSAAQFHSRLLHIQTNVGRLRRLATSPNDTSLSATNNDVHAQGPPSPRFTPPGPLFFGNYDWGYSTITDVNPVAYDWTGLGRVTADPLENPLLQTFLDHTDATWDPNTIFSSNNFG